MKQLFYKFLVKTISDLCDSRADQDRNDQGNDPLENELGGQGKCEGGRYFRPDEKQAMEAGLHFHFS